MPEEEMLHTTDSPLGSKRSILLYSQFMCKISLDQHEDITLWTELLRTPYTYESLIKYLHFIR